MPADSHVYSEPSAKAACCALSRSIVLASSMEIGRGGMASCARSQRQVRYLLFAGLLIEVLVIGFVSVRVNDIEGGCLRRGIPQNDRRLGIL